MPDDQIDPTPAPDNGLQDQSLDETIPGGESIEDEPTGEGWHEDEAPRFAEAPPAWEN